MAISWLRRIGVVDRWLGQANISPWPCQTLRKIQLRLKTPLPILEYGAFPPLAFIGLASVPAAKKEGKRRKKRRTPR
jgi:hypothetical protein